MTLQEIRDLRHGVYRIYWKDAVEYPFSVGAIGSTAKGTKWFMPANWVGPHVSDHWGDIEKVELIEEVNYDQKPMKEDLTSTGTYKVQIFEGNKLRVQTMTGYLELDLLKLLESLRECGYKIEEPPSRRFLEIKSWLDSPDQNMKCTDATGNMIYTYEYNARHIFKTVTIAQLDSKVNVTINNLDGPVFVGHVLSLEEFKLIWNRIL